MLDTRFGVLLYLLLPNDLVWALMSERGKERVREANLFHNTQRPDYANPECYGGGRGFDSEDQRVAGWRGRVIQRFLHAWRPETILEVGPGSGFFTRQIVEYPTVSRYYAVDINDAFLKYMAPRLEKVSARKPGFCYQLWHGTIRDVVVSDVDAVVLVSAVHHIPDRADLFDHLAHRLSRRGVVLAIDGTHYLQRMWQLLRKCLLPGYLDAKLREAACNQLSTHHMCRLGEYRWICRHAKQFTVDSAEFWGHPRRALRGIQFVEKLGWRMEFMRRLASAEMAIILTRNAGAESRAGRISQ